MEGSYLEVWRSSGHDLVPMPGDRFTVGADPRSDLPVTDDRMVSRLHAVLEHYPTGWSIKDMASRNGTFVNGERLWGERTLRHGDEILAGRTRIVFKTGEGAGFMPTEAAIAAPDLTRREVEVLAALCRPLASGDVFCEPASNVEIAEALVISEAAVRQHLARLYDKFGLHEATPRRRAHLANEAIRRGAVGLGDLRA